MDWNYIAGFFDGEGNLHIKPLKGASGKLAYQLQIRLYSSEEKVLLIIKEFIGYGHIYVNKCSGVYELTITKKKDALKFLMTIKDRLIIKKNQAEFVLKNYSFERGNNFLFDLDTFRGFITRKNVTRKHHTLTQLEVSKL